MIEEKVSIGVILLAAGSSSRMGQSKQLLIIDGQPLLRRTVKMALESDPDNFVVVLGSNSKEHQNVIGDLPVKIIYNEDWQMGIGNSIKKGLATLLELNPETQGVVVLVCDQPLLTAAHIKNLIQTFKNFTFPITASAYADTIGVPALFDKSLFKTLSNLSDSHGAKSVIRNFSAETKSISFPNGAIDLDTPDDLLKLKSLE